MKARRIFLRKKQWSPLLNSAKGGDKLGMENTVWIYLCPVGDGEMALLKITSSWLCIVL